MKNKLQRYLANYEYVPTAVQEAPHVQLHYTVTPIGGKPELLIWRAQREIEETKYKDKELQRLLRVKEIAKKYIEDQNKNPFQFTSYEQKETDRVKFSFHVLHSLYGHLPEYSVYEPNITKKSLIQKVKALIIKAFFPQ